MLAYNSAHKRMRLSLPVQMPAAEQDAKGVWQVLPEGGQHLRAKVFTGLQVELQAVQPVQAGHWPAVQGHVQARGGTGELKRSAHQGRLGLALPGIAADLARENMALTSNLAA